ncbi:MAG: FecR domain-containing protein [Pseudomonadota bacterium]
MTTNNGDIHSTHDPVDAVLERAQARAAPPADHAQDVRQAVHAEWRAVVAQRQGRRRRWQLAAAASVIAALALLLTLQPRNPVPVAVVADIDRTHGSIYLAAERSELIALPAVSSVYAGQIVQTGSDGLLGLKWAGGGSLRLDSDTRIEFVDAATALVHRGNVYVDLDPQAGPSNLVLETPMGSVRHVGTQYLASVARDELVVSVREGQVQIAGRHHDGNVTAGRRVTLRGSAPPVVTTVARFGALWEWSEALSPGIDLDNHSAFDFLAWVGRETGYSIVFEAPEVEQRATETLLVGTVAADPRTELRLRMLTTDLAYSLDSTAGQIRVSLAGDGGR